MLPALLTLGLVFGLLFFARIAGVYRGPLLHRWPAALLALAAILALLRGAIWPGIALLSLAGLVWSVWPQLEAMLRPPPPSQRQDSPEDSAARALLGVGADATAEEIRRAYRAKMARHHPDRGGSHGEAARLTAARDRLLNRKR
ncbi:MAG: J domain-containing protein [Hyphomonadaceae bacterium]